MLPISFLVIGAAKCGTTSLCDLLAGHPDVFVTEPKEPHYFSRLVTFERKQEWYRSLFEGSEGFRARGEGSTSYTHPHRIDFAAPRIREALPHVRLVYMVRHPVRRLESDWRMRLYEDRSAGSISRAAEEEASLITFGLYWKHLSVYRRLFSDEQLMVVFLEDFAEDPKRELARVCDHLGVDPDYNPIEPDRARNASRDFRRDDAVASALRSVPGLDRLKQVVPEVALDTARRLFTQEFRPVVDWEPDVLRAVHTHFVEDSAQLLAHCGKPAEFWTLDP